TQKPLCCFSCDLGFPLPLLLHIDLRSLLSILSPTRISKKMAVSARTPDIMGERQYGQDMLVDDIGDVTITNDGATVLKMLDVEHPAAKVLVELAELQDQEVGDGTTSVVIIAAELLKRANDLVRNKIHPTSIISGYRLAMREAYKYVDDKLAVKVEKLVIDSLVNCAKTSMSSKLIAGNSDFFANLVVEAVQAVKMTNAQGEIKYPIKGINILKAHGKSAKDSYLLTGYALNTGRAAQGMPLRVAPARIACLDFNLQKTKMQLGIQVLVTDPRELEKIRQREADITKERIGKLLKAGANVYFVEAGVIAVRRVRKVDIRQVAKATGATVVSSFADMEGEETFDSSLLGHADEVVEERIADDDVIMIKGTKKLNCGMSFVLFTMLKFDCPTVELVYFKSLLTTCSCWTMHGIVTKKQNFDNWVSLILRGANDYMLDKMERALHDSLCITKRTLESNTVVAGGGAVEAALSVYLEYLATTLGSREQLAIAEFAESLLIIPKILAVNAAKDATELVAKLRAYHHTTLHKGSQIKSICLGIWILFFCTSHVQFYLLCLGEALGSTLTLCLFRWKIFSRKYFSKRKSMKNALCGPWKSSLFRWKMFYGLNMGLDLLKGTVRNNLEAGVIEPAMSKVKFATEATITILRIDDMIKLLKDESQNGED
ncbi:hypothetical protein HYC85_000412, partial [Camellia sinensis]